ncbi:MAG: arabinogalactan endo-1,4-beta-galactosidase [bacterium]|nr:arabinogalactan endo-1,4-beta-galactosidase [bacterium]
MSFLMGADLSSLQAMEDYGAKYYDLNGSEKDAIEILKAHGVNAVRLRIWNQPEKSFDRGDYCDLKGTLAMAKRIKEAGLRFMLDFHYSDFWADWKKQTIPAQWSGQGKEELAESVYRYTKEVLQELKAAGAYPDVVQIGNEIGCGLLWDFGTLEHPENIAYFLNRGIRAVRDTDRDVHQTEVMIHLECGGNAPKTEQFFTMLEENGVTDYDVIGLSYYPYWSGGYEQLRENMRNLDRKFRKRIMIAETAFPYTDESNDDTPNVVTSELTVSTTGLQPSAENQRRVLEEIIRLVKEEGGSGVFYWEPAWYCIKGAGVEKGSGNEWENQALFDKNGRALEGVKAFGR